MINFDEYIQQGEPQKREKGYAWQTAIGLQAVDGLKPSKYLIDTARKHIEGDITIDEVQQLIKSYYDSKDIRTEKDNETEEADKVSANITKLLNERSFAFTVAGLTAIHRRIFDGVFKFAGQIRDYNITKKEWVLRGDTVFYVSAPDIRRAIEYDLEQEKTFDYTGLDIYQIASHVTQFVSGLWQIHPFGEGNTRTTAVFAIQYLRSMGFNVENDLFAKHSWYFRNALVRANYQNIQKGIKRESAYLERFFRNLLMGENNELRNRFMIVNAPEDMVIATPTSTPTSTPISTPISSENPLQIDNENIIRLIKAIANNRLSVKEMMAAVGLKDRENFMEYSLNPAIKEGFVSMLYPDKPRHPRQKYLLTIKGLAVYNSNYMQK
ncbi:Fic family protein [Phocaeicola dorei]|uniref:Fic family protein n=1 Tax=Phocaeicola dorei TaxID=357276 RepID=UPI0018742FCF|nr:Fic family protein [Phocaeicola dorei]MBE5081087.1 Fic family protein [Phocaeicola dorei]